MTATPPFVYGEGLSLVRVLNMVWVRARLVVGLLVVGAVVGIIISFAIGVRFTARSSFLPQTTSSSLGQVAGLAAQLGLSVPTAAGSGEGADFYSDLLKSESLLREAVLAEYRVAKSAGRDTTAGNLLDIWDVRGGNEDDRIRRGVDRLRGGIRPSVAPRTSVVTIVTTARWPELAVQINQRLLDLITRFNVEKRRSQAAAERMFVEGRLAEARDGLAAAENELEQFQERNRQYQRSPELTAVAGRLQRQVDLRQQVFVSLSQSYEKARIDEVRNTPVVTFVDQPGVLMRDSGRHLARNAALGVLLGGGLGLILAFLLEYLERERERYPEDYAVLRNRLGGLLGRRTHS